MKVLEKENKAIIDAWDVLFEDNAIKRSSKS